MRQAAFKGLREDKSAKEVVRENAEELSSEDARVTKSQAAAKAQQAAKKPAGKSEAPAKSPSQTKTDLPITHPDKVLDWNPE